MNRVDKMVLAAKIFANNKKNEVKDLFVEERGDVNVVSMVVLVAVAVVLGIAFKDRVVDLLSEIFDGMDTSGANSSVSI